MSWAMPASDCGMKERASKPSIIKVELIMEWIIEWTMELVDYGVDPDRVVARQPGDGLPSNDSSPIPGWIL